MVVDDKDAWEVRLPDLRTRLAVTSGAGILQPDDALFSALIELLFADRGLHIPGDAMRFITGRVHRDYLTAEQVVEATDRLAHAAPARLPNCGRGGGGDRPLRHCRAGAADFADGPQGADRRRPDRPGLG